MKIAFITAIPIALASFQALSENQLDHNLRTYCFKAVELSAYSAEAAMGYPGAKDDAYGFGDSLDMTKAEVDRVINYYSHNRDIASKLAAVKKMDMDSQTYIERSMAQNCMEEPVKYIPSYTRLVKQGILPKF
ncbi:hypothetical protein [Rouxiella sp. WC2420]|uniref:Uncharacterized protein n=1 Tax=Rouxiella sp. WC2420 TaxID=3234145 RepID=A0AB39VL23_9GAMM